jgi:hypothetical protein
LGVVASGGNTERKKCSRKQNRRRRDGRSNRLFEAFRKIRIVDVAKGHQGQDEKDVCVGMARAPEVLPQRIRGVARIMEQQIEETKAAENDGRKDHQKDTPSGVIQCSWAWFLALVPIRLLRLRIWMPSSLHLLIRQS